MTDSNTLAERLMAADEGSRDLDAEMASRFESELAPVTTSIDAALALAERVLDPLLALGLLHAVIDEMGQFGWSSRRIAPLLCAVVIEASEN